MLQIAKLDRADTKEHDEDTIQQTRKNKYNNERTGLQYYACLKPGHIVLSYFYACGASVTWGHKITCCGGNPMIYGHEFLRKRCTRIHDTTTHRSGYRNGVTTLFEACYCLNFVSTLTIEQCYLVHGVLDIRHFNSYPFPYISVAQQWAVTE